MMQILKYLSITITAVFIGVGASAQTDEENIAKRAEELLQMSVEDYLTMDIPPLGVLMENARNHPIVAYYDDLVSEEKSVLKSERRDWLTYFKLNASYFYGRMNDNILNLDNPAYNGYTDKEQSYYNLGGSISFPLSEIFDRHNRVKRQKIRIRQAEANSERWFNDLALKVVDEYTEVIKNLSMLRVKAEAATIATQQYKISQTDFINGKMDAQGLARQKIIQSSAVREYEETRAALNNALLKLEILTQTKILKK